MEFFPSKKQGDADSMSGLIPSFNEPLSDTVIAALRAWKELKEIQGNIIQELPVILDEKKIKAKRDKKLKEQVKVKDKDKTFSAFSIFVESLMDLDRVVMPHLLQKWFERNFINGTAEFHLGHIRFSFRARIKVIQFGHWKSCANLLTFCSC